MNFCELGGVQFCSFLTFNYTCLGCAARIILKVLGGLRYLPRVGGVEMEIVRLPECIDYFPMLAEHHLKYTCMFFVQTIEILFGLPASMSVFHHMIIERCPIVCQPAFLGLLNAFHL